MSFLSFFCQGKMHFSIQASIALCNTKCVKFKKLNFTMLATTDFSPSYFVEKILLLQAQILYPLRDTKSACQGKIPKTLKTKKATQNLLALLGFWSQNPPVRLGGLKRSTPPLNFCKYVQSVTSLTSETVRTISHYQMANKARGMLGCYQCLISRPITDTVRLVCWKSSNRFRGFLCPFGR